MSENTNQFPQFGDPPPEVEAVEAQTSQAIREIMPYGVNLDPLILQTRLESLIMMLAEEGVIDFWSYQKRFHEDLQKVLANVAVECRRQALTSGQGLGKPRLI